MNEIQIGIICLSVGACLGIVMAALLVASHGKKKESAEVAVLQSQLDAARVRIKGLSKALKEIMLTSKHPDLGRRWDVHHVAEKSLRTFARSEISV